MILVYFEIYHNVYFDLLPYLVFLILSIHILLFYIHNKQNKNYFFLFKPSASEVIFAECAINVYVRVFVGSIGIELLSII